MGGRLEVESREGLGTRFVIRLPLAEAGAMLRQLDSHSTPGQPKRIDAR